MDFSGLGEKLGKYGQKYGAQIGTTIERHPEATVSLVAFLLITVLILCCCCISLSVIGGLGYFTGHDMGIKKICKDDGSADATKCPQPSNNDSFKSIASYKSRQIKTGRLPSYRSIYKF
uniref:Uncharacterized protein n=1 Tax=Mimivirus LCMiAC01 TaxID=2506608 RepID=A0A481YZY7_9VIRU|nr:MAG: hypothetical protein LCMiAC01_00690 [Mimivirus LCMiAC01]